MDIETRSSFSKPKRMFYTFIITKQMNIISCVLLILLTMIVTILIIYFRAPRQSRICELKFKRTMKSSLVSSSKPQSVALGDLNNDHQIDFIIANSGTNTIGIFISNGNGTFINKQQYSTGLGSSPRSIVISDVNNDSYADIIVANYGTNNIGSFLGCDNGTFTQQNLLSLSSSHPIFVTNGDFNKDNRIDIAVVNYGTNNIGILFGYGNGSFQHQKTYSTGYDSLPSSLSVADFNNDTYLDIAVANYGTSNIGIFINYGNGTFTNQQIYITSLNSNPSSIAVGDFNNDNQLDIVVANYGNESLGIFFGYGNGSFLPEIIYRISSNVYPQYITINDINNDNQLDIAIVDSNNDQIHILQGYGNGSFARITTYDGVSGSMPVCIAVDDFNNNNQSDIVVVNNGTNNVIVLFDYSSIPSARKTNPRPRSLGISSPLAISDFNNDHIIDIVFSKSIEIDILIGLGNGTFIEDSTYLNGNQIMAQYVCTEDLNNDNRMDLIIADIGSNSVDIFLGYGNGKFGIMTRYFTGINSGPISLALGDINNDNVLDIVSANAGTNTIGIFIGYGDGTFTPMVTYSTGNGEVPYSVAVGDIDNDNRLDIVVSHENSIVVIFLQQNNTIFIIVNTYLTGIGAEPTSIALADFNGDNHLDIVVANAGRDNIGVFLGYGDGSFASQTTYSTGAASGPYSVIINDFNYDNISDIAATNHLNDEIVIFYGYGNGSFELTRTYSTGFGSKPYGLAAVDLNNDKKLEIVVSLWGTRDIAILTEYYAAEFINKAIYTTGSIPQASSLTTGDFNNDNQTDIVVANSGIDNLGILLGLGNSTFGMEMIYSIGTDSHPQYVISCDIDKDNQLDIVSVNSKMNSISVIMGNGNGTFKEQMIYSSGNDTNPYSIVSGDLNNDNRLDLVITNEGADSIGILFGFNYTSFRRYETYSNIDDLGAKAIVVSDFNNDNILDLAASYPYSDSLVIFLGIGNGSFSIIERYSTGKWSGPGGITVGDLNNDNRSDIVVANRHTSAIGVCFGYGNGSFAPIVTYSIGDNSYPIAVAVGDLDNDSRLDIIVANPQSNNIVVLLGHENGSFTNMKTYSTGELSSPTSVTVGDFNNDGRLDIAVVNSGTENVGVFLGYGDGTFMNQITYPLHYLSGPRAITVGDFNRDNKLDIAAANTLQDSIGILLGYGNGSFASVKTYSAGDGSQPIYISVGDFNNDNISDIAVANYGTKNFVVLFGFGDGSFFLGLVYSSSNGSLPTALATGDFNKDGRLDVAMANQLSNTTVIFLGYDSQPFAGITTYTTGDRSQPHSVALGHFNNDTWLDIVVANYGTNSISILLGQGALNFNSITLNSTGNNLSPYSVAVAYLNNDIYLDIVVSYSGTDNIAVFLGYGNGRFKTEMIYSTGTRSRPYKVITADFNNDSIKDIAVANSGTSNIFLLYGYGNGTFGNQVSYPLGYGYDPYSIDAEDLNGDGWIDIVIACYNTDHIETLIKMC